MQKHPEKVWLAGIRAGKAEAFEQVYNTYIARIYRFVLFKVSTHQDAEDLSAEVFLKAWQYLYHQQRPVERLSAFLYQVAKNLVIDFYRQRAQHGIQVGVQALERVVDLKQQRLFQRLELGVELGDIEQAVFALKDEFKDVVLLRYVEELTIGEIAAIIGKSRGAVRVMLFRAIKRIREQLTSDSAESSLTRHFPPPAPPTDQP